MGGKATTSDNQRRANTTGNASGNTTGSGRTPWRPLQHRRSRQLQDNGTTTGNGTTTETEENTTTPAPAPLVQQDPLTAQECTWGVTTPEDYWFVTEDCGQHGSFLYRIALLYEYIAGCVWMAVTFLSQIVRVTSRPEPWFFNPQAPNEGRFWRFCRLIGP